MRVGLAEILVTTFTVTRMLRGLASGQLTLDVKHPPTRLSPSLVGLQGNFGKGGRKKKRLTTVYHKQNFKEIVTVDQGF